MRQQRSSRNVGNVQRPRGRWSPRCSTASWVSRRRSPKRRLPCWRQIDIQRLRSRSSTRMYTPHRRWVCMVITWMVDRNDGLVRSEQNGQHFVDFSECNFMQKNNYIGQNFQWSLFQWVRLTVNQHWYRQWLGATKQHGITRANNPRSLMPYGITRPQWVNSLWPSDTTWWYKTWSTLAQVMACCLMTTSHYLSQCWLIISEIQWHSYVDNFSAIYH